MGVTSSNQRSSSQGAEGSAPEGSHFANLLKPPKREPGPNGKMVVKPNIVTLHEKARILKRINVPLLWDNFLCGPYGSFVISPAETAALLLESATVHDEGDVGFGSAPSSSGNVDGNDESPVVKAEVASYLELLAELTEKDVIKAIDFMSICSSALLISKVDLSVKIDYLYQWMTLSGDTEDYDNDLGFGGYGGDFNSHASLPIPMEGISFEMFIVSLSSFERGLSHAMGVGASSENYVRDIATLWFPLANGGHKPATDMSARITANNLQDFCMNQQLPIRRLLEALSTAVVRSNKASELVEVVQVHKKVVASAAGDDHHGGGGGGHTFDAPTGGDEFMANPAWKKTAEKMVPKDVNTKFAASLGDGISKAPATLTLDWVHGYRGFDCRNNVFYIQGKSTQILFPAAGVSIVQEQVVTRDGAGVSHAVPHRQAFFGEHTDDVIALAMYNGGGAQQQGGPTLIASGEIGKTPAIHVYLWTPSAGDNASAHGNFTSIANISGYHKKGIAQLSFSVDGKSLISISIEYAAAVYNTDTSSGGGNNAQLGKMMASSQGPKGAIFHVCSVQGGGAGAQRFLSVGEKHYCVWTYAANKLTCETGKLGALKSKNMLSVCRGKDELGVIGSVEGDLVIVRGVDVVHTHSEFTDGKSVNALWSSSDDANGLVIAGLKNGHVVLLKWMGERLQMQGRCVAHTGPLRAVCLSPDKESLLIGTQSCEISQLRLDCGGQFSTIAQQDKDAMIKVQGDSLVVGHFKDELWGLAVRPTTDGRDEDQYCTVGDDGYLRIWSITSHRQIQSLNMGGIARSCAYSPDGVFLAVAFGGSTGASSKKNKEDGMIRVYRQSDNAEITCVKEMKEAKQWISVVRFSPDGSVLVAGSRDNSIYIYAVAQQFKRKAKFSKHNAGINQLDFTVCGRFLQSCCSGYEILFSDVNTGTQVTNGATQFLEESWHTWTLTLGWPVMGIWKGDMDGSDINAVARSPSNGLLATADDFGHVCLYRYPCINTKAEGHVFTGHSSHVTCVRWASAHGSKKGSLRDNYLISTGGDDKCVFQWKCTETGLDSKPSKGAAAAAHAAADSHSHADSGGFNLLDAPTGGDEFTAVKAWLGAIVAPTAWTAKAADASKIAPFKAALGEFTELHKQDRSRLTGPQQAQAYDNLHTHAKQVFGKLCESGIVDASAPDEDELEVSWVHGYRGFDTRNNVRYAKGGQGRSVIVYHAASMGVVLESPSATNCQQRYFKGHKDDIMAIAVYFKGAAGAAAGNSLVATGQQGLGALCVWDAGTQKVVASIETQQKSIHMLEFSCDGRLLVSIAEDKTVAVSDWKSQKMLVNTKGEAAVTFHLAASDTAQTAGNFEFLSCGDKHIRYWTLSGKNLAACKVSTSEFKDGAQKCAPQAFLCVAQCNSQFYIGAEDGWIYITIDRKKITKGVSHHEVFGADAVAKAVKKPFPGSVTAIYAHNAANIIVSGAKDGTIVVWNSVAGEKPTPRSSFSLAAADPTAAAVPDSVIPIPFLAAKQIQTICLNEAADLLLVGTRGCDMLELSVGATGARLNQSGPMGGILVRGHCNDELWGLATHPRLPEFCTVGDDKTLRFFSIHSKSMLASVPLGNMARACAIHPEAPHVVAVGFGGRVGRGKESGGGLVRVYSYYNDPRGSTKLVEVSNAKQWISNVKFSADGRTLVAGAHDNKVYVYTVNINAGAGTPTECSLTLRTTFAKHNSVINHMDLSVDGRFMQSTCSAYELLFSDTASGKQCKAPELKDVVWDTFTCPLGWPVQGIWAPGMDGSDINSVCRSYTGHVLATSDDFGKVNLFRYPATTEHAKCNSYGGHSSHVMNVRWSVGDEFLISVGGNDKCAIVWRHKIAESIGGGASSSSSVSLDHGSKKHGVAVDDVVLEEQGGGGIDLLGAPTGGDESGCVKPWLGAIKTPKHPPHINAKAPAVSMELSWVHGYASGRSAANTPISNNLHYNANGELIFHAAALGVRMYCDGGAGGAAASAGAGGGGGAELQDLSNFKQQYFRGHDDDILCLAISPCRRYVATGQTASKATKGKGSVCVWDAVDCRQLSRMDGCHQRGVNSLAFSPDSAQLLSVGMDDKNTHTLWKDAGGGWSKPVNQATEPGDQNQVLFSMWVNPSNESSRTEYQFVSGGNSVQFWKIEGAKLTKKNGRFGGKYKQCPLLCAGNIQTKDGWRIVAGASTGDVYVFSAEKEVCNSFKAHEGPVLALAESGTGGAGPSACCFIVTGGRDRTVKVWNHALSIISSFTLNDIMAPMDGSVAALDVCPILPGSSSSSSAAAADANATRLRIVAGTQGGDIVEIISLARDGGGGHPAGAGLAAAKGISEAATEDVRNKDLSGAESISLLHSHAKGEQWGLATHPTDDNVVATVGDDGALRIWSISQQRMVALMNLQWPARSVCWHPSGHLLCVGFHEAVKGGVGAKGGKKGGKAKAAEGGADGAAAPPAKEGAIALITYHELHPRGAPPVTELKKVAWGCSSTAWIADVKFSAEGDKLAVGSHDKHMFIYKLDALKRGDGGGKWPDFSNDDPTHWADTNAALQKKPAIDFNKHSSAVLHVDFSRDGFYTQTNCQAGELLFLDLRTGKQEPSATKMADYQGVPAEEGEDNRVWDSQTCVLGWPVQGIWTPDKGLSDINAADKHHSGTLLATADDFGLVNIYRYPCVEDGSKCVSLTGHSSHVTCVRWTASNRLVSVGGNDKCTFIWAKQDK